MNRLSSEEKASVESAIATNFPDYTLHPATRDQQGQNGYAHNFILERGGKSYLLKVLFLKRMLGAVDVAQAEAEVEACRTTTSSFVVPLLEAVSTEDYAMLLFPLLEGQTLAKKAEGYSFSEEEVKDVGIALLMAVSDIWRKGNVVHQDIKPANIFVTEAGDIKLLDFGAVRYKQSPFRGTARHNFAYASPEQILAAPPQSLEVMRRVIDDRSDVFAVGLIMYSLIEGRHPYEDTYPAVEIARGKPIPPISRTGISNELKEIVYSMLSFKNTQRPHASQALQSLQQGSLAAPSFDKGKFYYSATNGLSRFHELVEKYPDLFDGAVVDATQIPTAQGDKTSLQISAKSLIVDPQAYLFQKPARVTPRVKSLPYASFAEDFTDGVEFVSSFAGDAQRKKDFVKEVLDFQIQAGATALVPPFFYVEDFNDVAWTVDQEVTEEALRMIRHNAYPHPVIKGIALQQGVLTSTSKENMIEYLTSLEDVAGFLVLLDSAHTEVVSDEPWLKSARELFTQLLSTGKSVIWARADVSGLVMAHPSLSLAMGESLSARKFNIDAPLPSGGTQVPMVYLPAMFARAKWPLAMTALKAYPSYDELVCDGGCCDDRAFENLNERNIRDLALHMMCQFGAQFRKYAGAGGISKAKADIKKGIKHYDALKRSTSRLIIEALRKGDIKPQSAQFLENWLNALHSR